MARIYISSTYEDLKIHRDAVAGALRKMPGLDVIAMEDYVADDSRPLDMCLQDVRSCDIYIGIIAWRYGYVPEKDNPDKKSITEREYLEAAGKTRLMFLLDKSMPWLPDYLDSQKGDATAITRFRDEIAKDKLCSFFSSPDKLAALVTAAVFRAMNVAPPAPSVTTPLPREVQHSVLLAYSPYDDALAKVLGPELGFGRDKGVLLSKTALFCQTEADFEGLEGTLVASGAGLLLLTPASVDQLKGQLADTERILVTMRARLGAIGAVLVGIKATEVPFGIAGTDCFELSEENVKKSPTADPTFPSLKAWVDAHTPSVGIRALGLPVSVLAMTHEEATELFTSPDFVFNNFGKPTQDQFNLILANLDGGAAAAVRRYQATREEWLPFDPAQGDIRSLFRKIVDQLNRRNPPRLRQRQVKLQWYPFDVVKEASIGSSPLRRVYQGVANSGCVFVVDEMSLFHPALRNAFFNSPFFNKDQVAVVTVSPADPIRSVLSQAIETSLRNQLASVFQRYADDFDPQCEVAISDQRRLLRWLYASVPEAIANLRDPRPNQEAIKTFFEGEGLGGRATGGDYVWGGGHRS